MFTFEGVEYTYIARCSYFCAIEYAKFLSRWKVKSIYVIRKFCEDSDDIEDCEFSFYVQAKRYWKLCKKSKFHEEEMQINFLLNEMAELEALVEDLEEECDSLVDDSELGEYE